MANHKITEGEFICGNRDGRLESGGIRNETYTVCRFNVLESTFAQEVQNGFHPGFVEHRVSPDWRCPAQSRAKPRATKPLTSNTKQVVDLVHRGIVVDGQPTCVICRLGVDRRALVAEVDAGKHPGFRTIKIAGERFVQGKGPKTAARSDNVNFRGQPCAFH